MSTSPETSPHSKAATSPDYSNEPLIIEHSSTLYRYNADGTGDRTIRAVLHVQSEATVRQFGVLNFAYASDNEAVEFKYVRVRKPDDRILPTEVLSGQDMPAEVTRQAPLYSDQRQLQIPVHSLAVGDRLEYEVVVHMRKAEAANEFWGALNFEPRAISLDERVELRFPSTRKVTVQSPGRKPDRSVEEGDIVYRWQKTQTKPTVAPPGGTLAAEDEAAPKLVPDIGWTTFADWAAVGIWYRTLAADRAAPDAVLRAKATELTAGATTEEEKLARIYNFVSMQIHYIGVDFGLGRYQPHAAAAVLENGYGDCKDKHTLLASLLTAEGFHVEPVLIGAGVPMDKDLPAPNSFNHVITSVELGEGATAKRLWLDSTAEVAPPGMLNTVLRDKEALIIPATGPPLLMKTPATPPFAAFDKFVATGTIAPDGKLTAHIELTLRGDLELIMRSALFTSGRGQWTQIAQGLSGGMGFGGTVSDFDAQFVETPAKNLALAYTYSRDDYGDWANHHTLLLLPAGLFALAELTKQPQEPILLGAPRVETAKSTLTLPEGFSVNDLPSNFQARSSFADYAVTYSTRGRQLVTEATLTYHASSVPAAQWQEFTSFSKQVNNNDGNSYIALVDHAGAPNAAAKPAQPAAALNAPTQADTANTDVVSDTRAEHLLMEAQQAAQAHHLDEARTKLEAARAINPVQPGIWFMLAFLDAQQARYQEAEADLEKEKTYTPEQRYTLKKTLLQLQLQQKHFSEVIGTLDAMREIHPENVSLTRQQASLLTHEKRHEEAIALLSGVALRNPSDKYTMLALGRAQFAAGRPREGRITLETTLEGTDDPEILNDAAYMLADHNFDLPAASVDAHKALTLLDKQTASANLDALTQPDLGRQQLLGAMWDTAGWIEYLTGSTAAAESYLRAAWLSTERAEVGYHLGILYEKEGKVQQAFDTYTLANAARTGDEEQSPDLADLRTRADALAAKGFKLDEPAEAKTAGGVKLAYKDAHTQLADLRSLDLPLLAKKYSTADFLVLATAGSVEKVQFLEGDPLLREEAPAVKAALSAAMGGEHSLLQAPKDSAAHLIRRGILSCSPAIHACQFILFLPQDMHLPKPASSIQAAAN